MQSNTVLFPAKLVRFAQPRCVHERAERAAQEIDQHHKPVRTITSPTFVHVELIVALNCMAATVRRTSQQMQQHMKLRMYQVFSFLSSSSCICPTSCHFQLDKLNSQPPSYAPYRTSSTHIFCFHALASFILYHSPSVCQFEFFKLFQQEDKYFKKLCPDGWPILVCSPYPMLPISSRSCVRWDRGLENQ